MQSIDTPKSRPALMEALAFGIYYFIYLLATTSVSYHAGVLFSGGNLPAVFSAKMLAAGLGYLSFPLVRRRFPRERTRRGVLICAGAAAILGAVGMTAFATPAWFLLAALAAMLALGHIGGFVYYAMSQVFAAWRFPGRAVSVSAAVATGLHFLIQNSLYSDAAFLLSVGLGTAVLLALVFWPPRDWILSDPLPARRDAHVDRREALALLAVIAVLTVLFRVNDSLALSFYSTLQEGGDGAGAAPLAAIPGILLAGLATDRRSQRWLNILVGCGLPLYAAATTLLVARQLPYADIVLMYFCGGVYVVFIIVQPMCTAARSGAPALWAGMGRVVRNITIGLTLLPMSLAYQALGWWFLPASSALLACLALFAMFISGMLSPEAPPAGSGTEPAFAARYGLTDLEWQVCHQYILSEDSTKTIAEQLYLSQRTVERYIKAIYEKTGTRSRVGLVRLYFEKQAANP